ncbi:unnamed protein product, partial [marine sediment metagenome]
YRKHYIQIITMIISLLVLIIGKKIKFDLIHAHFMYRPGYIAAVLGRILDKPVVVTAHGSDIHQNLYDESGLFRKRTINTMRWTRGIIGVSQSLKNMIAEEGFGYKTFVIPAGFSGSKFFAMDTKECRDKLFLDTNIKILLFIGNLVAVKGVDILIKAFKIVQSKMDNAELMVIG